MNFLSDKKGEVVIWEETLAIYWLCASNTSELLLCKPEYNSCMKDMIVFM